MAKGRAPVTASIGIASGLVVVGETGTARRAACVGVGAPGRRAARLQALADQASDVPGFTLAAA